MAKYQKRKSYWKGKCDELFSEIIRLRAKNLCQETNARNGLQCSHIISRSYLATRWDFENAISLNFKRHKYYTHHPVEWHRFIEELVGKKRWEDLEKRATQYRKWSLSELKELYDQMVAIRNSFNRRTGKFQIRKNPGRRGV